MFGPFLIPPALILVEEIVRPRVLRPAAVDQAALLGILLLGVLFSYSRGAWLNLALGLRRAGARAVASRGGARQALALRGGGIVSRSSSGGAVVATGSGGLPGRAGAPADLRHRALQRPARRAGTGRGVPARRRAGPVRADRRDLGAQHVRTRDRRGGHPRRARAARAARLHAAGGARNAARGRDTYGIGSAALLGAWCGLLANSAFIDTLHWRHLWLVAGLIWAGAMRRRGGGPGVSTFGLLVGTTGLGRHGGRGALLPTTTIPIAFASTARAGRRARPRPAGSADRGGRRRALRPPTARAAGRRSGRAAAGPRRPRSGTPSARAGRRTSSARPWRAGRTGCALEFPLGRTRSSPAPAPRAPAAAVDQRVGAPLAARERVQHLAEARTVAETAELLVSRPAQVGGDEQRRARPAPARGRGRPSPSTPSTRHRAGHEHDMLRLRREPEPERGSSSSYASSSASAVAAAPRPERRGAGTAPRAGRPVSLLSCRVPPMRGAS